MTRSSAMTRWSSRWIVLSGDVQSMSTTKSGADRRSPSALGRNQLSESFLIQRLPPSNESPLAECPARFLLVFFVRCQAGTIAAVSVEVPWGAGGGDLVWLLPVRPAPFGGGAYLALAADRAFGGVVHREPSGNSHHAANAGHAGAIPGASYAVCRR